MKKIRETLTCERCGTKFTAVLKPGESMQPMGACQCGNQFTWTTEPYEPKWKRRALVAVVIAALLGLVLLVDYLVRVQPFPAG